MRNESEPDLESWTRLRRLERVFRYFSETSPDRLIPIPIRSEFEGEDEQTIQSESDFVDSTEVQTRISVYLSISKDFFFPFARIVL